MQKKSCCDLMATQLAWSCETHVDPFDCPGALILKSRRHYGLILHDGSQSALAISFCPWCGTALA